MFWLGLIIVLLVLMFWNSSEHYRGWRGYRNNHLRGYHYWNSGYRRPVWDQWYYPTYNYPDVYPNNVDIIDNTTNIPQCTNGKSAKSCWTVSGSEIVILR